MVNKLKKASIVHARTFRHKPKPTEIVPELSAEENSIHGWCNGDLATNSIDVDWEYDCEYDCVFFCQNFIVN